MLTRCPRRISKAASLRDATCVAKQSQHANAALFLAQRRGYSERHVESYTEQLLGGKKSDDFSFDNSFAELFGDAPGPSHSQKPRSQFTPKPRRQGLTKQEQDALSGMLDMIITPPPKTDRPSSYNPDSLSSLSSGLFDRLRKVYKSTSQRSPDDVLFDEKKEQIGLCTDDAQLFEWTLTEVFGESERYEAAARAVMAENAALPPGTPPKPVPPLQPPTYRRVIPHLMHIFRDQYRQPHLSIAIFRHAQRLSSASFVHGCSTDAYNELLETQWALRDLVAVRDVLQEMHRLAVPLSRRTDQVVDRIRRDLSGGGQHGHTAAEEQMRLFAEVEEVVARISKDRKEMGFAKEDKGMWDAWKRESMDDVEGGFDDWSGLDGRDEQKARHRSRLAAGGYDAGSRPSWQNTTQEVMKRAPFSGQGQRERAPHDSRDRRSFNARDRPQFDGRDRPPFNPRDRPPFDARDRRPPFNPRDRPPFDARDRRPPFEAQNGQTFRRPSFREGPQQGSSRFNPPREFDRNARQFGRDRDSRPSFNRDHRDRPSSSDRDSDGPRLSLREQRPSVSSDPQPPVNVDHQPSSERVSDLDGPRRESSTDRPENAMLREAQDILS